jgi:hypothetical protein
MDTNKLIQQLLEELHGEKRRLDQVIVGLKALESGTAGARQSRPAKRTRGRKSMSPAERREVSERMSRYWAKRREQSGASRTSSRGGQAV